MLAVYINIETLHEPLTQTRHVRAAFKAMTIKTDRKDAMGIAQLMRMGWFRPVHCKSLAAQEVRALLTARKLLQSKRIDVEMSLRGVLRGFGLKVGKTTPRTFASRIGELTNSHDVLKEIADTMLKVRDVMIKQCKALENRIIRQSRRDKRVRLLMTTPGVTFWGELEHSAPDVMDRQRQAGLRSAGTARRHGRPMQDGCGYVPWFR